MKKILMICCSVILFSLMFFPVHAASSVYSVEDLITGKQVAEASSWAQASVIYEENKGDYEELAIILNERILAVEYGVLSIPTDSVGCSVNYEFMNVVTRDGGYVNGCYGRDALYLDSDEDSVKFMISGATGMGDFSDNATIIPLSQITSLSSYIVIEDNLYHQIKSDVTSERFSSLINLGKAPDYLMKDQVYLSYDGHYFYLMEDFKSMSDDIRNNQNTGAINNEDPYFNYYQYVSHRTLTEISLQDVDAYFHDQLKIDSSIMNYNDQNKDSVHDVLTQSQFYDNVQGFYQNQNIFGSNAMMMLALSMNESATGRSSLAYTRNNLFGHAAYDSDVEKNASRYFNVYNSIYSHAKNYISNSYLNPNKFQYHGGHFGNKASGMNVSYASDPYWGEKAAQNYYLLDEKLGLLDENAYALGIIADIKSIVIYDENQNELTSTETDPYSSFVVLEETATQYKIQLDAAYYSFSNIEGSYDFQANVGYIDKELFDVILNKDKIKEDVYVTITLDAQEGTFNNEENTLSFQVPMQSEVSTPIPTKDNALFVGWDKEVTTASKDEIYVAHYREVESIQMHTLPPTVLEYYDRLDLTGGSIEVVYQDGESEIVALTSSMVSGYDNQLVAKQEVLVSYAGATTSYPLTVSMELEEERVALIALRENIIDALAEKEEISEEDIILLKELFDRQVAYEVPWMNFSEIRALDQIYYRALKDNLYTVVKENDVNLALSGLYFNVASSSAYKNSLFKDTIYISYSSTIDAKRKMRLEEVALGNGYQISDSFTITGKLNTSELMLEDYIIVSIDIPEEINSSQSITVLQYHENDVVRLATTQTENRITFKTNELGSYIITTRNTTNTYEAQDITETLSFENNQYAILTTINLVIALLISLVLIAAITVIKQKRMKK